MSPLKFTDAAARMDRAKGLPQPYPMRTDRFVGGPTPMNGHDAWAIMRAALRRYRYHPWIDQPRS